MMKRSSLLPEVAKFDIPWQQAFTLHGTKTGIRRPGTSRAPKAESGMPMTARVPS